MIDVRKSPCSFPHRDGKGKALGNYGRQSLDMQAQFQHLGLEVLLPSITTNGLPDDQSVHDFFL